MIISYSLFRKKPLYLLIFSVLLIGCFLYFLPRISQVAGNLFFGKIYTLYNVTLAQVFFKQASYPLFGKSAEYAHYQLSRTYFIQGDLNTAISEVQKELEIYPDHTRAYYILGLTYGYMNEEEKAIGAFSKFIEANPTSWAARNDKAWLQFRIGDIDGALETIQPVAHAIDNPWVQNTYGTLLMNKKFYEDAKAAFEYARTAAHSMTEESWGRAYPGNDPRIYETGLRAMRLSIESNLKLLEGKYD
jgi:tetratricopeptide (TPR) repeat protein